MHVGAALLAVYINPVDCTSGIALRQLLGSLSCQTSPYTNTFRLLVDCLIYLKANLNVY